ANDENYALAA
ncbi:tmRNA-encoded proteolysis-inducing peptide tag, partial [Klebsiella pneumoniae]